MNLAKRVILATGIFTLLTLPGLAQECGGAAMTGAFSPGYAPVMYTESEEVDDSLQRGVERFQPPKPPQKAKTPVQKPNKAEKKATAKADQIKKKEKWDEEFPPRHKGQPKAVRKGDKWYYVTKTGKKIGPFEGVTPWGTTWSDVGDVKKNGKWFKVSESGSTMPWKNSCCSSGQTGNVTEKQLLKKGCSKKSKVKQPKPKTDAKPEEKDSGVE